MNARARWLLEEATEAYRVASRIRQLGHELQEEAAEWMRIVTLIAEPTTAAPPIAIATTPEQVEAGA